MFRKKIQTYSDHITFGEKKRAIHALIVLCLFFFLMTLFLIYVPSVLGLIIVVILDILLGLAVVNMYPFKFDKSNYFGSETKEYKKYKLGESINNPHLFSIFSDRLQFDRDNEKQLFFKDIISIYAIPIWDFEDDWLNIYIEIRSFDMVVFITDFGTINKFMKAFEENTAQQVIIPTLSDTIEKFGKIKFRFSSMLNLYSPLRVNLFSKNFS